MPRASIHPYFSTHIHILVLESVAAIVTLRWAAAALVVGLACGIRVCLKTEISKGHIYHSITKSESIEDGMEASEEVSTTGPEGLIHNGDTNEKSSSPVSTPTKTTCPWNPLDPCKIFLYFYKFKCGFYLHIFVKFTKF